MSNPSKLTLDRDLKDGLLIVDAATGNTVAVLTDTPLAASLARTLAKAPELLEALDALIDETDAPHRCSANGSGHFVSDRTRTMVNDALSGARGGVR